MGDYYFHYTSRHLAQEIIIAGRLKPGQGGRLYLTERVYEKGADAARYLAITGKPVEVTCVIPKDRVKRPSENRHVEAIFGADGSEIRPGCGTEQYTEEGINVEELSWLSLAIP